MFELRVSVPLRLLSSEFNPEALGRLGEPAPPTQSTDPNQRLLARMSGSPVCVVYVSEATGATPPALLTDSSRSAS